MLPHGHVKPSAFYTTGQHLWNAKRQIAEMTPPPKKKKKKTPKNPQKKKKQKTKQDKTKQKNNNNIPHGNTG